MASILRSKIIQKPYQLFHYYFLLEKAPGSTVSDLNFDTNIQTSLRKLKHHHWTVGEIFHYGFWFPYFFRVCGFPSFIFIKLPIILAFATCF